MYDLFAEKSSSEHFSHNFFEKPRPGHITFEFENEGLVKWLEGYSFKQSEQY